MTRPRHSSNECFSSLASHHWTFRWAASTWIADSLRHLGSNRTAGDTYRSIVTRAIKAKKKYKWISNSFRGCVFYLLALDGERFVILFEVGPILDGRWVMRSPIKSSGKWSLKLAKKLINEGRFFKSGKSVCNDVPLYVPYIILQIKLGFTRAITDFVLSFVRRWI